MHEAIVKLAKLQRGGGLPASSEEALALAFADQYAEDLRYVAAWNRWLSYNGCRWERDETWHTFDRVRALIRATITEGAPRGIASAKTVAAVERLAKSDRRLAATVEQWDDEPGKIVDGAATFDLCDGTASAPDPLDYITRRTACAAAPPGTPHPLWTTFLARVTAGDAELQRFLQRYIGYCLTGFTTEHAFAFAYGTGANGKSTFINTIFKLFGDYATVADMNTFLTSSGERHPTELAKLHGARLVVAQETEKGRRWDEIKLKALTGGDKVTARYMRQDHFDFTPAFKLFITGNHKPRLSSVDEAMRRRLLLVPFTVRIPEGERDTGLPDKLQREGPAILRWCIDGATAWYSAGLQPPACVRDATDAYLASEDAVGQWVDECTCDGGPLAFTSTSVLFASWKTWCEDNNFRPGTSTAFSYALQAKGHTWKRTPAARGFERLTIGRK
jgi:putative DNA primase/helicase